VRGRQVAGTYGAGFTPTFVFIRTDGTLQSMILGETGEEDLQQQLDLLLSPPN